MIVTFAVPAGAQPWVSPRTPVGTVQPSQVQVPTRPGGPVRSTYQYPPSESLFEGFYAGIGLGADIFGVRGEQRVPTLLSTGAFHFRRSYPGFAGDIFFGFGRMLGPGIYGGVEIDFGYSSVRGRSTGTVVIAPNTYSVTVSERFDFHFSGALRLGYTFTPNFMAYGRVGWGGVHHTFDFSTVQTVGGAGFDAQRSGRILQGPRIGAGVEYVYFGNIRVRAEYIYTWVFEHTGEGFRVTPPGGGLRDVTFIRPNAHSLRLAVIYGF